MIRKVAVIALGVGLAALNMGGAHATGTAHKPRTAEVHDVIGPFVAGWIAIEGAAQEAPGAASGTSVITAECTGSLYSLSEKQYRGINLCTLQDLTSGTAYGLTTVTEQPNLVVARGVFTLPTSHNYAICPKVEIDENTARDILTPGSCATMS